MIVLKGGDNMTTDLWRERSSIRKAVLKELYDYNFQNAGKPKDVKLEVSDGEKKTALLYLSDKNLVELINFDHPAFPEARITADGIDEIENEM